MSYLGDAVRAERRKTLTIAVADPAEAIRRQEIALFIERFGG